MQIHGTNFVPARGPRRARRPARNSARAELAPTSPAALVGRDDSRSRCKDRPPGDVSQVRLGWHRHRHSAGHPVGCRVPVPAAPVPQEPRTRSVIRRLRLNHAGVVGRLHHWILVRAASLGFMARTSCQRAAGAPERRRGASGAPTDPQLYAQSFETRRAHVSAALWAGCPSFVICS
jgi:hypothetical protein